MSPNDTEYANICTARAYFLNTTLDEQLKEQYKRKNRFIGRFPIEPFVDEFEPSEYNINSIGHPKYKATAINEYNGFGVYPNWKKVFPFSDENITKYSSAVERTSDPRTIIVTFPAEAQLNVGEYKLVIVAQVYMPGYKHNVKTITTDYNKLFELVSNTEDADVDGSVEIELNNSQDSEAQQDIYVISGTYDDGNIKVRRNDNHVVNIDVTPITDWYEGD